MAVARDDVALHRRRMRGAFPSVTGVLVYLMRYQLAPVLPA
jgi:hypothetical protein